MVIKRNKQKFDALQIFL